MRLGNEEFSVTIFDAIQQLYFSTYFDNLFYLISPQTVANSVSHINVENKHVFFIFKSKIELPTKNVGLSRIQFATEKGFLIEIGGEIIFCIFLPLNINVSRYLIIQMTGESLIP